MVIQLVKSEFQTVLHFLFQTAQKSHNQTFYMRGRSLPHKKLHNIYIKVYIYVCEGFFLHHHIQTNSGIQPASYLLGMMCSFPSSTAVEDEADPSPPSIPGITATHISRHLFSVMYWALTCSTSANQDPWYTTVPIHGNTLKQYSILTIYCM
jgi:hypothetical protein